MDDTIVPGDTIPANCIRASLGRRGRSPDNDSRVLLDMGTGELRVDKAPYRKLGQETSLRDMVVRFRGDNVEYPVVSHPETRHLAVMGGALRDRLREVGQVGVYSPSDDGAGPVYMSRAMFERWYDTRQAMSDGRGVDWDIPFPENALPDIPLRDMRVRVTATGEDLPACEFYETATEKEILDRAEALHAVTFAVRANLTLAHYRIDAPLTFWDAYRRMDARAIGALGCESPMMREDPGYPYHKVGRDIVYSLWKQRVPDESEIEKREWFNVWSPDRVEEGWSEYFADSHTDAALAFARFSLIGDKGEFDVCTQEIGGGAKEMRGFHIGADGTIENLENPERFDVWSPDVGIRDTREDAAEFLAFSYTDAALKFARFYKRKEISVFVAKPGDPYGDERGFYVDSGGKIENMEWYDVWSPDMSEDTFPGSERKNASEFQAISHETAALEFSRYYDMGGIGICVARSGDGAVKEFHADSVGHVSEVTFGLDDGKRLVPAGARP